MKKSPARTVRGWVIKPSKEITFGDIMKISNQIGARVRLKYNFRRREFIAYTLGDKSAKERLATLLGHFPTQNINV